LENEGFEVERAESGQEALAVTGEVDVIILALMPPDIDGLDACRLFRDRGFRGGILILSVRAGEIDRVVGLDAGADDYMTKPFRLAELHARLRALVGRTSEAVTPSVGKSIRIEAEAHRAFMGDEELHLSPKEFEALRLLTRNAGKVIPREVFTSELWREGWDGSAKTFGCPLGPAQAKARGPPSIPGRRTRRPY
jgi:DNA-binding response OmpR family regulator